MDQFYVESGYIDDGYFTYIAVPSVELTSDYQIQSQVNVVSTATVTWTTHCELASQPSVIYGVYASLQCNYDLSSTAYIDGTSVILETLITLSLQGARIIQASVNLEVNNSISSDCTRLRTNESQLSTINTIETIPTKNSGNRAELSTTVTLATIGYQIVQASANLSAVYSITSTEGLPSIHYVYTIPAENRIYMVRD